MEPSLQNDRFMNNHGKTKGGAITAWKGTMDNFYNNTASSVGAIYLFSSNATLMGDFKSNVAKTEGGK